MTTTYHLRISGGALSVVVTVERRKGPCWQAKRWQQQEESWAVVKMTARCALYMGALKIFGSPW